MFQFDYLNQAIKQCTIRPINHNSSSQQCHLYSVKLSHSSSNGLGMKIKMLTKLLTQMYLKVHSIPVLNWQEAGQCELMLGKCPFLTGSHWCKSMRQRVSSRQLPADLFVYRRYYNQVQWRHQGPGPLTTFPPIPWILVGKDVHTLQVGFILDVRHANEKRRYKVTPSIIGWVQT